MFGRKDDKAPQEAPKPEQTPEYIKNLEALIRVIARQEAEKVLMELLSAGGKDIQGDSK